MAEVIKDLNPILSDALKGPKLVGISNETKALLDSLNEDIEKANFASGGREEMKGLVTEGSEVSGGTPQSSSLPSNPTLNSPSDAIATPLAKSTGLPDRRSGPYDPSKYGDQAGRLTPEGKTEKYENNSQGFSGSPMAQSDLTKDALSTTFHNQRPPNLQIEHEKPEHYVIMLLKAQGLTNEEISEKTKYSVTWISQVIRQPWFVLRLHDFMEKNGADVFQTTLKAAVVKSLDNVITIANAPLVEDGPVTASVKLKANLEIIRRFYGDPVQKVEQVNREGDPVNDIEQMEKEVQKLQEALKETPKFVEVPSSQQN